LIDAEGTFGIVLTIDSRSKTGWNVYSRFRLELNKRDIELLNSLQSFFKVGRVGVISTRELAYFEVKKEPTN